MFVNSSHYWEKTLDIESSELITWTDIAECLNRIPPSWVWHKSNDDHARRLLKSVYVVCDFVNGICLISLYFSFTYVLVFTAEFDASKKTTMLDVFFRVRDEWGGAAAAKLRPAGSRTLPHCTAEQPCCRRNFHCSRWDQLRLQLAATSTSAAALAAAWVCSNCKVELWELSDSETNQFQWWIKADLYCCPLCTWRWSVMRGGAQWAKAVKCRRVCFFLQILWASVVYLFESSG